MSILVVAPHADDEVLGCGGSMALAAAQGVEVHVLVVTQGDPSIFPDEITDAITREMQAAHRLLGVSRSVRLDFNAPKLDTLAEHVVVDAISAVVSDLRPDTVLMPHRGDPHVDHNVVTRAVTVATRPQPGQPVRTVLEYETASETEWAAPEAAEWFVPNVYVDIGEHLDAKLEAMACYASQVGTFPHPRSVDYLRHLAHVRGGAVGLPAAEAFRLTRTTAGAPLWFGATPV